MCGGNYQDFASFLLFWLIKRSYVCLWKKCRLFKMFDEESWHNSWGSENTEFWFCCWEILQCLDFINCQKTETDKRNVEFLGAVFFEVICLYKKDWFWLTGSYNHTVWYQNGPSFLLYPQHLIDPGPLWVVLDSSQHLLSLWAIPVLTLLPWATLNPN